VLSEQRFASFDLYGTICLLFALQRACAKLRACSNEIVLHDVRDGKTRGGGILHSWARDPSGTDRSAENDLQKPSNRKAGGCARVP